MTPEGNLCHGYQHRSWLWWGQRPRHGPWLQFKPKTTSWPAAVAQTVQLKIVLGWHGPQKPPPQVSFRPSVVAGAMGIDADHGCRRVTNSDMALGRSPGPGQYHVSRWQTGLSHQPVLHSLNLFRSVSFCSTWTSLCPFLSIPHYIFAPHNGAYSPPLRANCSELTYVCPSPAARI